MRPYLRHLAARARLADRIRAAGARRPHPPPPASRLYMYYPLLTATRVCYGDACATAARLGFGFGFGLATAARRPKAEAETVATARLASDASALAPG